MSQKKLAYKTAFLKSFEEPIQKTCMKEFKCDVKTFRDRLGDVFLEHQIETIIAEHFSNLTEDVDWPHNVHEGYYNFDGHMLCMNLREMYGANRYISVIMRGYIMCLLLDSVDYESTVLNALNLVVGLMWTDCVICGVDCSIDFDDN